MYQYVSSGLRATSMPTHGESSGPAELTLAINLEGAKAVKYGGVDE